MGQLYAQIECDLMRDTDLLGEPLARLLYIQAVLYCRENLTDGRIDRKELILVAVDIPSRDKQIAKLVTIGKLEPTPTGWRIPEHVWRQRNPMKAEVASAREAATQRKRSQRDRQRGHTDVTPGQDGDPRESARKPEPEPEPKPPVWVSTSGHPTRAADQRSIEDEAIIDRFYDGLRTVGSGS